MRAADESSLPRLLRASLWGLPVAARDVVASRCERAARVWLRWRWWRVIVRSFATSGLGARIHVHSADEMKSSWPLGNLEIGRRHQSIRPHHPRRRRESSTVSGPRRRIAARAAPAARWGNARAAGPRCSRASPSPSRQSPAPPPPAAPPPACASSSPPSDRESRQPRRCAHLNLSPPFSPLRRLLAVRALAMWAATFRHLQRRQRTHQAH